MDTSNWISKVLPFATAPIENRARLVRVSVSSGTGGRCAYCHKQIDRQTVEYEVDAHIPAGLRTLHFHRVCLHLWEELPSQRVIDVGPDGASPVTEPRPPAGGASSHATMDNPFY